MATFGAISKNVIFQFKTSVDSFWATIGKIWLLSILTSGNTELVLWIQQRQQHQNCLFGFQRRKFVNCLTFVMWKREIKATRSSFQKAKNNFW